MFSTFSETLNKRFQVIESNMSKLPTSSEKETNKNSDIVETVSDNDSQSVTDHHSVVDSQSGQTNVDDGSSGSVQSVLQTQSSSSVLLSSNAEVASVIDEDTDLLDAEEASLVKTSLTEAAARRQVIMDRLKDKPYVSFTYERSNQPSSAASGLLGRVQKESQTSVIPIQAGMVDEINRYAVAYAAKPKRRNPDKVISKIYQLPEAQASQWVSPPGIPGDLLNILPPNAKNFDKTSNAYCLAKGSSNAQIESRLKDDIRRSLTTTRVQNVQALGIAMIDDSLKASLQAFTDLSKRDTSRLPKDITDLIQKIVAPIADAATAVQEIQVNLNDMIKLNADTYIKASTERRKLWVDTASQLPVECKADIQNQPVPVPTKSGGLAGELNVLGSQGLKKLREWGDRSSQRISLQLQKHALDAVKNQATKQQQQPFRAQKQNNPQKKQNFKGKNNYPKGNNSQNNNQTSGQNKSNQNKGQYKKKPFNKQQKS
jgi:hypothetical protein